jgi:hypothetical protein
MGVLGFVVLLRFASFCFVLLRFASFSRFTIDVINQILWIQTWLNLWV